MRIKLQTTEYLSIHLKYKSHVKELGEFFLQALFGFVRNGY